MHIPKCLPLPYLQLLGNSLIGWPGASYKNSVLFCWVEKSLNLICISKLLDISFAILHKFSKPCILNSLKKRNDSVTCLIAMPMGRLLFCNTLVTKFIAWVIDSSCPAAQAEELIFLKMFQRSHSLWGQMG